MKVTNGSVNGGQKGSRNLVFILGSILSPFPLPSFFALTINNGTESADHCIVWLPVLWLFLRSAASNVPSHLFYLSNRRRIEEREGKKEGRKEGRFRRSSNRFRDIESGGAAAVWQFGLFEAAATVSAASFVLPQQTTGQEFPDALRVTRKRTHDALQHIVF